jgi:hypothetical protein
MENNTLRSNIAKMESQARKVNADLNKLKQMDDAVMVGLKKQAEAAKNELERLKRKRVDSPSPVRIVTGILQCPVDPSPLEQLHTAKDDPPPSAQPTPKKSRSRKDKWGELDSSRAPPTSSNKDGVKEKHTSLAKKRDPVLNNPPSNSRRKQDIINEIEESAKTLSLSRADTSFVFHRSNVDEQVVVTKKALAYVESLITTTCVHMLKGAKATGNPVQAYLDTLSLSQIVDLQKDVDAALEQCEDSSRHMAVYRGGDDLARRIRTQCFDNKTPRRPHKANDLLHRLYDRLGCHKQHSIPIGFYYAKWSEKLHFHLSRPRKHGRSHSTISSARTRTPSPKMASAPTHRPNPPGQHIRSPTIAASSAAAGAIEEIEENLNKIREKRAAILMIPRIVC